MDFIATKDLKAPTLWREKLRVAKELVVTNNGTPVAVMLPLENGGEVEDVIRAWRQARAGLALSRIREAARNNGTMDMSLEEINKVIAEARAERRARKQLNDRT